MIQMPDNDGAQHTCRGQLLTAGQQRHTVLTAGNGQKHRAPDQSTAGSVVASLQLVQKSRRGVTH
jgi:hypothetical protein